jgi:hypothetical protein
MIQHYRLNARGTCPPKAGRTGTIPNSLMRVRILCCKDSDLACHESGSGPPNPRMLPIRNLESTEGVMTECLNFIIPSNLNLWMEDGILQWAFITLEINIQVP